MWIEIVVPDIQHWKQGVTLHARVWIEINTALKSAPLLVVTLHARVWIEITVLSSRACFSFVTLHARVWIEIRYID